MTNTLRNCLAGSLLSVALLVGSCGSGADAICDQQNNPCPAPFACVLGTCKAPSCTDNVIDGSETDLDCGGSCAAKCANGKHCLIGPDCTGGICASGKCAASAWGS